MVRARNKKTEGDTERSDRPTDRRLHRPAEGGGGVKTKPGSSRLGLREAACLFDRRLGRAVAVEGARFAVTDGFDRLHHPAMPKRRAGRNNLSDWTGVEMEKWREAEREGQGRASRPKPAPRALALSARPERAESRAHRTRTMQARLSAPV